MYNLLKSGYVNYLMVIACILGIAGTWMASHQYKRLINETDNMMGARHPFLLQIKNKFENMYRINSGINNIDLFVERSVKNLNLFGVRTTKLGRLSSRMAGVCFFLGIFFAWMGYSQDIEFKVITMYLLSGILTGCANLLFAYLADIGELSDYLELLVKEYFENTFINRLQHARIDENYLKGDLVDAESEEVKKSEEISEEGSEEESLAYLKQSLDRIASDRESAKPRGRRHKFTPKEEKLLEEILKEYFA